MNKLLIKERTCTEVVSVTEITNRTRTKEGSWDISTVSKSVAWIHVWIGVAIDNI